MMDFDIYDDLDNYLEVQNSEQLLSENKELKIKLEENSATLNKLKEDFDRLSAEHQLLLKNFSTLLKTAKAEIERKTQTIMQINIEKDELFLRLATTRFHGKKPMAQRNVINERSCPQDVKNEITPGNDAKDVIQKEITGNRNRSYATRQQMNKMDDSSQKQVQNTTTKVVNTNEIMESSRDKENQVKCTASPVEKEMLIDKRAQDASKLTSDEEEGEIADETIDLRNKINKTRSQDSTHPVAHTKEDKKVTRSNKHSRNKEYEIKERDFYRYKKERSDIDRQYRSRAPERDVSNEKYYQRGRSRHRAIDSPSDRYYRDKSRGRRNEYKQDRFENESECKLGYDRVKHKASEGDSCEPAKKRRRNSMYDGPEERRSRRNSEHFEPLDTVEKAHSSITRTESIKGSTLGERLFAMSCQSPDDPFAERNLPLQPLKLISHTATTKLDDPRETSRRYISIQDKDNKACLIAARSTNVQLMKVPPWIEVDSKPVDEDKVAQIYADIDKQINNMSVEADKSAERKEKSVEMNVNVLDSMFVIGSKESNVPKEDVKQAVETKSDPPVMNKIYKIPKKTANNENEKNIAKKDDKVPSVSSRKSTVSRTKPDESKKQALTKEVDFKHIKEKPKDKDQIEIKSKESKKSSKTKLKPAITSEIKQKGDENDNNVVQNKDEPTTSKPEPCNPLQILYNHLKLAQANSQIEEPKRLNKDDISPELCIESQTLNNHAESNNQNDTKPLHQSVVEGDLELSDETSDFTQFNEKYSQETETPEKKKTTTLSEVKDVKDPTETEANLESKIDKKTQEIKAKFSDLFGDTSCSLITPEDLNIPKPSLESYPCFPSMESSNEPWSLRNSPWKPEMENPDQDKEIEEDVAKEREGIKENEDETLKEKLIEKAKENEGNYEHDFEPEKRVLTPVTIKPKATLPNGLENHNTEIQCNYKTPMKALATSTPLRPIDKISNQSKMFLSTIPEGSLSRIPENSLPDIPENSSSIVQEVSLSKIPENSLSKIPEKSLSKIPESPISKVTEVTSDLLKDLSVSDSSHSHTAADIDKPDVRIVIKRKKRVLKK